LGNALWRVCISYCRRNNPDRIIEALLLAGYELGDLGEPMGHGPAPDLLASLKAIGKVLLKVVAAGASEEAYKTHEAAFREQLRNATSLENRLNQD